MTIRNESQRFTPIPMQTTLVNKSPQDVDNFNNQTQKQKNEQLPFDKTFNTDLLPIDDQAHTLPQLFKPQQINAIAIQQANNKTKVIANTKDDSVSCKSNGFFYDKRGYVELNFYFQKPEITITPHAKEKLDYRIKQDELLKKFPPEVRDKAEQLFELRNQQLDKISQNNPDQFKATQAKFEAELKDFDDLLSTKNTPAVLMELGGASDNDIKQEKIILKKIWQKLLIRYLMFNLKLPKVRLLRMDCL